MTAQYAKCVIYDLGPTVNLWTSHVPSCVASTSHTAEFHFLLLQLASFNGLRFPFTLNMTQSSLFRLSLGWFTPHGRVSIGELSDAYSKLATATWRDWSKRSTPWTQTTTYTPSVLWSVKPSHVLPVRTKMYRSPALTTGLTELDTFLLVVQTRGWRCSTRTRSWARPAWPPHPCNTALRRPS